MMVGLSMVWGVLTTCEGLGGVLLCRRPGRWRQLGKRLGRVPRRLQNRCSRVGGMRLEGD